MTNTDNIVNLVNIGNYRSISSIEKIDHSSSLIDIDYDFKLNLQTIDRLSNTIDIFLTRDQVEQALILPVASLLRDESIRQSTTMFYNIIPAKDIGYYKLPILLPDGFFRNLVKKFGCNLYLKLKYYINDNKFLCIESDASYKILFFKHRPRNIQPASMMTSLEDAETFLINLDKCL